VSCEPLLGPLDLRPYLPRMNACQVEGDSPAPAADAKMGGLSWVIVGGESGPNARPMHPQWIRDIRDQCQEAGVPFFFKQWGEWTPYPIWRPLRLNQHAADGSFVDPPMSKVGTKAAGAILDGREWREFP